MSTMRSVELSQMQYEMLADKITKTLSGPFSVYIKFGDDLLNVFGELHVNNHVDYRDGNIITDECWLSEVRSIIETDDDEEEVIIDESKLEELVKLNMN